MPTEKICSFTLDTDRNMLLSQKPDWEHTFLGMSTATIKKREIENSGGIKPEGIDHHCLQLGVRRLFRGLDG
jgi:hypothetical protein